MISQVVKRNGTLEPFDPDKLNKWAQYVNGDWSSVALATVRRLSNTPTTEEIHQTMIAVCLERETLEYSRAAARLLLGDMNREIGATLGLPTCAVNSLKAVAALVELGIWKITPKQHSLADKIIALSYIPLMAELESMEYWQLKQWCNKYSLRVDGKLAETPIIGFLGIAVSAGMDEVDTDNFVKLLAEGVINLPTPMLNGCRNGDFNFVSCSVITGEDSVDSIGVAEHLAYTMTSRKAGIGINIQSRSEGSDVKGGRVKHLGKQPIYAAIDKAIKMFTQVGRGGSATITYDCIDPDIISMIYLKSQRVDESIRLDKVDFSMTYNRAFVEAVVEDKDWYLFDRNAHKEGWSAYHSTDCPYATLAGIGKDLGVDTVKARDVLKAFLTVRQESGRLYCLNLDEANENTSFTDRIYLSNLCQEITLPTSAYDDMYELHATQDGGGGEVAFCTLGAINVAKTETHTTHHLAARLLVDFLNRMLDKSEILPISLRNDLKARRSLGVGITGLAGALYARGLDFDGSFESKHLVRAISETHYEAVRKASSGLQAYYPPLKGQKDNWLPKGYDHLDAKERAAKIRQLGQPVNSALIAHMPTESSALLSDATNGVYPVRGRVIYKGSRTGAVQYIAPEGDYKLAWDIPNNTHADYYAIIQDFTDQAISADYFVDFNKYPDGKVPMSQLMKEWVYQARQGIKTMYYQNTNDSVEEDCDTCKL
jgi:ribonucleotide reductase alpha subunit